MGVKKTSLRYFMGKPVRAIWDEEESAWYFSAADLSSILSSSSDPRRYWNNLKKRHPEIKQYLKSHYLYAGDKKKYLSDTLNEKGVSALALAIPTKQRGDLLNWLKGSLDPLDEQSKKRAYELYGSDLLDSSCAGTFKSLQQIHSYLFGGLYEFAGKMRSKTISKGDFVFASGDYLPQTLKQIDEMKDDAFEEIVQKYIEMNIAHPFMEGNGRSTRIWLDLLLKERLKKCVDWSLISKEEYLEAMKASPYDMKPIFALLQNALTDKIEDREIFMKGIDCSYYYEEVE